MKLKRFQWYSNAKEKHRWSKTETADCRIRTVRSAMVWIITGIRILRKLKNILHAHESRICQYIISIEAVYNSVIHSWPVYGSLCYSNRDLQPCEEFPLGNVVHAKTGPLVTDIPIVMLLWAVNRTNIRQATQPALYATVTDNTMFFKWTSSTLLCEILTILTDIPECLSFRVAQRNAAWDQTLYPNICLEAYVVAKFHKTLSGWQAFIHSH